MKNDPVETVMGHVCVALGQGTGAVRVSRAAVEVFYAHYRPATTPAVVAGWEAYAVQVLERIRAVGRLAAQAAVERGKTAIGAEETLRAARAVERESGTPLCPPQSQADEAPTPIETLAVLLGQVCVAFGQGTGPVRVSREAVAALRDRYGALFTEDLARRWDDVAVQALERIRAIGRLAAHLTTSEARTAIGSEELLAAAHTVEAESNTDLCPPRVAPQGLLGVIPRKKIAASPLALA
jgi:hypothetical protein